MHGESYPQRWRYAELFVGDVPQERGRYAELQPNVGDMPKLA